MAIPTNSPNTGVFAPTTNVWDVSNVESANIKEPGLRELLIRLYQNLNLMALVVNNKDSGYYNTMEMVNSQAYFPNPTLSSQTGQLPTFRQVYRTVVNFGPLPNTGVETMQHNIPITGGYTFTRIYGCATAPTILSFIPLPYVSALNPSTDNIELEVTSNNVVITTAADYSLFTDCYVVLEYIKF